MNSFGPRPITFDPEEAILQYLYSPASLIHRPEPDRAPVRFLKARQVQTYQVIRLKYGTGKRQWASGWKSFGETIVPVQTSGNIGSGAM
ncbi:MAG: hypothetical protein ACJ8BW_39590 [Ktedonobacteraceae bacterium]